LSPRRAQIDQQFQEEANLVGVAQGVPGLGRPIVALAAYHNAQSTLPHDPEGVLVRLVVPHVDGESVAAQPQLLEEPLERPALVPFDVRTQLEHLLAARPAQPRMCRGDVVHDGIDHRHEVVAHLADVHGDAERLALDPSGREGLQTLGELIRGGLEIAEELRPMLLHRAVREDQVEPVAPPVRDTVGADEVPNVRQVAAADDRDGHERRQSLDRPAGSVRQQRILGTLDDGRQRSVVVEEEGEAAAREEPPELIFTVQGVGQIANVPSFRGQLEFSKVGDDDVRPCGPQGVGVAPAIDPHDEPETTARARFHPSERVLDHGRPCGLLSKTPCGLDEDRRVGLAGQAELFGQRAIHTHREQSDESGRVQDLGHVAARGHHGRPDPTDPQLADEGHGRGVGVGSVPTEVFEPQLAFPVPQPAHGLSIRWVGGVSFGDLDGA
jgi:hypothetical protein